MVQFAMWCLALVSMIAGCQCFAIFLVAFSVKCRCDDASDKRMTHNARTMVSSFFEEFAFSEFEFKMVRRTDTIILFLATTHPSTHPPIHLHIMHIEQRLHSMTFRYFQFELLQIGAVLLSKPYCIEIYWNSIQW